MLRTSICDLLKITHPVVQGPLGPASTPALAAAVSNAGGLGSLAGVLQDARSLQEQIEQTRDLTDRPFAVNHVINQFDSDAFEATLNARPAVISFALGDPGELIARAKDAGAVVMQQVVTVSAAYVAAERGVDIIIAQGSEAGGNSGLISTLPLVPQIVDAVAPVPVLAAGGIASGRGLAAALMLGAQGANVGTRFLAAEEAASGATWQSAICRASSSDIVKFSAWNSAFPPAPGDYFTIPSAVRTAFTDEWQAREVAGDLDAERLRNDILSAAQAGRIAERVPLAGQTSGMISTVLPAAEILRQMIDEAVAVLKSAEALFTP